MSEHTPGPWSLREDELASGWFVDGAGHPLAFVDHSHANAALIAAAPELLEVLEELDRWAWTMESSRRDMPQISEAKAKARAAIAKAKGESQ